MMAEIASMRDQDKVLFTQNRANIRRAVINAQRAIAGDDWNEHDDLLIDRLDGYLDTLMERGGRDKKPTSFGLPTTRDNRHSSLLESAVSKAVGLPAETKQG